MIVEIDGFKLDISRLSKKITRKQNGNKIEVHFVLDFPPYAETKEFDTDKEAKEFINEIKKEGDKVIFK